MYISQMKKYCNIDFEMVSIKVNNQIRKFKYLDVFEEMCVKAWAIWMVSEKQSKYMIENNLHFQKTMGENLFYCKIFFYLR